MDEENIGLDCGIFNEPENYYKTPEGAKFETYYLDKEYTPQELVIRLPAAHPLWAHYLWNASKCTAEWISSNPELVRGLRVLELGAGSGLPSIVAGLNGAILTVCTDYPDTMLLDNIKYNITNQVDLKNAIVVGHLWGSDTQPLIELSKGKYYDLLILSDLIFNHSQHIQLVRSCVSLLAHTPSSRCIVFFSHHRPWLADKDNDFFHIAEKNGLESKKIFEKYLNPMYEQDYGSAKVRGTVHGYLHDFNFLYLLIFKTFAFFSLRSNL